VHVHHKQDASEALAAAAGEIADTLGLGLSVVDVDVPDGASFEGHAREVRLAALADAAAKDEWLVTGHHSDDSAETVFGNLLRGAGATGLSGIASMRQRWLRPLLDLDRAVVRVAADDLGLPYIDDPANKDDRHRRNVIRSEVFPWLEARLDIPVRAVINRSARLLAVGDAELEAAASVVPIGTSAGAVTVPAALLAVLPEAVAARVARAALRRAHPPYPGNTADVAAVLRVAEGAVPAENLSGGFRAVREGALVAVYDESPAAGDPVAFEVGSTVEFGHWVLTASAAGDSRVPRLGRARVRVRAALFGGDAVVRGAGRGEGVDIGAGSKPVRAAMSEAGVPTRLRSAWPVVAVGGKIAWVAGVRVAEWARSRPDGDPAVELSIEGTGV
jgi:tRNA(Ile)-lysidine synthase